MAVVLVVGALISLFLAGCGPSEDTHANHAAKERKILYYQSAMHPWIKSDKPGRCTICGMELTPVYEGEAGIETAGDLITLSDSSIRVLNVQTVEARVQPLTKTLAVAGTIDDNDSRHRVLSAYIPGRIEKLHVTSTGAEIKAGEPLAEFYSPAVLQAEREYRTLAASSNSEMRSGITSRLRQMGLTPEQIATLPAKPADTLTTPILAPISGTVTEKSVYAGQYVQEGEKLFEIADFSTMWFQFRAYEQDLPWLKIGLTVDVTTPSLPGQTVTGKITFIDPNVDETTRSTKVRVELENPLVDGRRLLAHRLYADGRVALTAPETLSVPRAAIIQSGPEAVAFVAQGGAYERRVVKLGQRGDTLVEVLGGLSAGDQVVVNGNLLLDGQAEMNRTYTMPAIPEVGTNATPSKNEPLTVAQRAAVKAFLTHADALAGALAADDLEKFNTLAAQTHDQAGRLFLGVGTNGSWVNFTRQVEGASHITSSADLKGARRAFHPLSAATVALAQAARKGDAEFSVLKIFRCPMTKDAFPGAPNRAEWVQLQPEIRNPWFGAEMPDCGSEVKP